MTLHLYQLSQDSYSLVSSPHLYTLVIIIFLQNYHLQKNNSVPNDRVLSCNPSNKTSKSAKIKICEIF